MKQYRTAKERAEVRRKAAANRLHVIGQFVEFVIGKGYDDHPSAVVTSSKTTSGAPLIRIAFADGDAFHVTVTKARK